MAEYVFPECPHCQHKNTFDLEELRRNRGSIHKGKRTIEAFYVNCSNCGRPFTFKTRSKSND